MRYFIAFLSLAFLFFIPVFSIQENKTNTDNAIRSDLTKLKEMVERRSGHIFMNYSIDLWRNDFNVLFEEISNLSFREIQIETMKLLAKLKDGHTGAWIPDMVMPKSTLWFPIRVFYFKEGLYIISASKEYKDAVGARINSINGIGESKVREALFQVTNGENVYGDMDKAPFFFCFPPILKGMGIIEKENELVLDITQIDGKEKSLTVKSEEFDKGLGHFINTFHSPSHNSIRIDEHLNVDWKANKWKTTSLYELEYLKEERAVFFKLNQLRFPPERKIENAFRDFWSLVDNNPVDKIILDLRSNGGGNLHNAWPFIFEIRKRERLNKENKLLVLTGRKTFSAATAFLSMLETHTNANFIGEPSAGRPNQTEGIGERPPYLKSLGLDIVISRGRWTHTDPLDSREFIEPDSLVPESFIDWVQGNDRAFNVAIDID